MPIDPQEIQKIATLAHLEFDESGLARMATDLSRIVSYIDQLQAVEIEVIDSAEPELPDTPLAADELRSSLPTSVVGANAPEFIHGHFVVPRVIAEHVAE